MRLNSTPRIASLSLTAFLLTSLSPVAATAQSGAAPNPATQSVRIRGTLVYVDTSSLIVRDRSGEVLKLGRASDLPISEVYPIKLTDIRKDSFIGTAAMPQPDGTQKALEVLVFPEAARGTGEGHFPWDLQPSSTMTNATVADLAAAPTVGKGGQQMKLRYKGGEQIVTVPPQTPVVTFRPGGPALLVPGANVMITAQERNGQPVATRVIAGRNGFTPPM